MVALACRSCTSCRKHDACLLPYRAEEVQGGMHSVPVLQLLGVLRVQLLIAQRLGRGPCAHAGSFN